MTGEIEVEALGGQAGFGGPNSALVNRGRIDPNSLSAEDRHRLEALMGARRRKPRSLQGGDMLLYRLTWQTPDGPRSVDVPQEDLPASVINSVRSEFRD